MGEKLQRAVDDFLSDPEQRDLVIRILRHGSPQSRAYALALIANASSKAPVEKILDELSEARNRGVS